MRRRAGLIVLLLCCLSFVAVPAKADARADWIVHTLTLAALDVVHAEQIGRISPQQEIEILNRLIAFAHYLASIGIISSDQAAAFDTTIGTVIKGGGGTPP